MLKKHFKIAKENGFARPAIILMSNALRFQSKILFDYKGEPIDLKNTKKALMKVMLLNLKPGEHFYVSAYGIDENQALESIEISLCNLGVICVPKFSREYKSF